MIKPSGESLDFKQEWFEGSPFPDYRIPGLFLAIVIGGANLLSALAQLRRWPWAPTSSLGTGLVLLIWSAVQWLAIGYRHWS